MPRFALLIGAAAVAALAVAPMLPGADTLGFGAAFAKNDKGNGGNGNGGNGNGNGNGKEKSAGAKSTGNSKAAAKKAAKAAAATTEVVEEELTPSKLGKMNGALHASINAITAHIRNGQITNGPVGLMAGLAVADAAAAAATEALGGVMELDAAHDALSQELIDAGYVDADGNPDIGAYLADADVPEETATAINDAIAAAGGLNEDGSFTTPAPTDQEIADAEAAATEAAAGVTAAEEAFVGAWNKDGDAGALLGMARERLGLYAEEIAAAIAETQTETEEVVPEEETEVEADAETDPALVVPTGG